MNQKTRIILFSIIILVLVAIVAYYLVFSNVAGQQISNINSDFVYIYSPSCSACTTGVGSTVYSLLSEQGYYNEQLTAVFGKNLTNSFISNNSITSLPSVAMPQTSLSANFLNALIYLNIFNVEGNEFVLNTPFLSGLTGRVTYYSIIQNRTITSIDIYNVSKVFGISENSPYISDINPAQFIDQFNSNNLSVGNKTEIILVYSDSPFSAIQSVVLEKALSAFGKFSANATSLSNSISLSSTESIEPEAMYYFPYMDYSSGIFSLDTYNLSDVSVPIVQKELFEYDQNAASLNSIYGSFTPFLDVGGKYISVSSMLSPLDFSGMNISQINKALSSNSTVTKLFNNAVSFLEAVLCNYETTVNPVCNTQSVEIQESNIKQQI